ncbi:helix-turn-helix domain-containing protein [Nisaea acidiphila]|uniref:Helix-turn-helix domain-containing protein n=1 Tax=Nisaea acidiphila TaxID=1862145 RepID=A0A9J7AW15_9PROT|nr:helix-turn-helix domain-containing protein [Nisaea acidiphila]UUX51310.1 helix-turn-helix domain-containing protein [Nisaea acidiphila]
MFEVSGVPENERFDIWRESISCIFEVEAPRDVRKENFEASVDANMFGSVMLARTQTRRQDWIRSPSLIGRDGMDHFMVQLYERGSLTWETSRGEFAFPENGLVVFDLAQDAACRSNNFSNLSLIVPRSMLEDQIKAPDDQHLKILSGTEPMVQLLRDHMLSLKRLSAKMTARQAIEIAPATVGLTAACLNAAVTEEPAQRSGVALAQMTVVRRLIENNLSHPDLCVDWIARHANVSRAKLYNLFEGYGGVANYVRDRRLRRALLALVDRKAPRRPIYDIALEAGYASDASFTRAFRTRYGLSPKEVRQHGITGEILAAGTLKPDRRYERWLHHLSA